MAIEIERKYLVNKEKWAKVDKEEKEFWRQGYLLTDENKTVRVRYNDTQGFITIKGRSVGISRLEFEYKIPKSDAIQLLQNFSGSILIKKRYKIEYKDKVWEVDEFLEDNEGLIIAEIELTSENEHYQIPDWIDKDVSDDKRYFNAYLSLNPYKNWKNS